MTSGGSHIDAMPAYQQVLEQGNSWQLSFDADAVAIWSGYSTFRPRSSHPTLSPRRSMEVAYGDNEKTRSSSNVYFWNSRLRFGVRYHHSHGLA